MVVNPEFNKLIACVFAFIFDVFDIICPVLFVIFKLAVDRFVFNIFISFVFVVIFVVLVVILLFMLAIPKFNEFIDCVFACILLVLSVIFDVFEDIFPVLVSIRLLAIDKSKVEA